ncbi:MAG: MCP four helix bundle domain-containing protein [Burkholderiaceae bacterium]|nr:MCP four helix bundle domain-containing protein [Roseateles sp.]MBV8471449.1 MCP four helix bundle domain-containing protein [Burkholderiaceae bacterium]
MGFISNLKIGSRLALAFASLLVLLIIVSLVGFQGVSTTYAGLKTVYEDRTVCLGQLAEIGSLTQANRGLVSMMLIEADPEGNRAKFAQVDKNLERIHSIWKDYTSTYLTPDEQKLADEYTTLRSDYDKDVMTPLRTALTAGEMVTASQIYKGKMSELAPKIHDVLEKLIKLQIDVAAEEYAKAGSARTTTVWTSLLVTIGAVALGVLLAWAITKSITMPVADALQFARAVAAGDLTSKLKATGRDEIAALIAALRDMNDGLVRIVSQVRQSSDSIATGSAQIATGNADLSQRTEEQASNLEETAASMEQMNSTVKQNADTAQTATQLASSASAVAARGGEVVGQVVATMDEITASSKKITDIIGVIDGIAFQTNILALNAAVEAARAGEQGRGFAVVASEVRSLAQRSAEAAREIKALISQSTEKVETGARLVGEAGTTMDDIVAQVRKVADLIGEIGAATLEQTQGIGQVSEAVNQLDQVTQQNAALVEESAAAAESLKHQAANLADVVNIFKLEQFHSTAHAAPTPKSVKPAAARPALSARSAARPAPPKPLARPASAPIATASSPAPASPARSSGAGSDEWESF